MELKKAIKLAETKILQSCLIGGIKPAKTRIDGETGEIINPEPGSGFVVLHPSVASLAKKILDILRGSGEYLEFVKDGKRYQVRSINDQREVVAKYPSSNTFTRDGVEMIEMPPTAYVGLAKPKIEDLPSIEEEVELQDVTVEEDVTVQEDTVSQL